MRYSSLMYDIELKLQYAETLAGQPTGSVCQIQFLCKAILVCLDGKSASF